MVRRACRTHSVHFAFVQFAVVAAMSYHYARPENALRKAQGM